MNCGAVLKNRFKGMRGIAMAAMLCAGAPAYADVKAGVDAWARGDYDAAVSEWQGPAAKGDPFAQFNMAQAYRLGRGVEIDMARAEQLYARAAAQGHIKAADNYGLLLFQNGRREQAMPYVTAASQRGDPRAQYLLGIAHFNGDLVEKDWVRAYALLTMANGAGLPQAGPAITQMDGFIPLDQRQKAQALAQTMKKEADTRRAAQLASADLSGGTTATRPAPPPAASVASPARSARATSVPRATVTPRVAGQTSAPLPSPATRAPQPIARTAVPPSVANAQAAVAEAVRVTGTESPAGAGADFARPSSAVAAAVPSRSASARAPVRQVRASVRQASANGPWKVQLGAFSVRGNADRLWSRLSGNAALSGKKKYLVPAGNLTKLQAGGFASRGAAQSACNTIKRSGQGCIVTR